MKIKFSLFAALFVPLTEARVHSVRRLEDFSVLGDSSNELDATDAIAGAESLSKYVPGAGSALPDDVQTPWFSEEGNPRQICPKEGNLQSILRVLYCSGSYCDNLKLQCTYKEDVESDYVSWTSYFSEEQGLMMCPGGYVITGIECRGSYCDAISLHCSHVLNKNWNSGENCDETGWFSEETGNREIPSGSYPVGIACGGAYCDSKNIHYCYERGEMNTNWFSEENNGFGVCPKNQNTGPNQSSLKGLFCSGAYCDNLKIHCSYRNPVRFVSGTWTGWFSEEQGLEVCGSHQIVTGIKCRGTYCDDIQLECKKMANYRLDYGNCAETLWLSEEQGYKEIPDNSFAVGIRCGGSYCDDKKIRYCTILNH